MNRKLIPTLLLATSLLLTACASPSATTATTKDATTTAKAETTATQTTKTEANGTITVKEFEAFKTQKDGEITALKEELDGIKKDTGKTFYILDEPTTGLHFQDIQHLLEVINKLVDRGNSVLVIEHNMDVIKVADHIIDIGPEGGDGGGLVLYEGVPEGLVKVKASFTGKFLKAELN